MHPFRRYLSMTFGRRHIGWLFVAALLPGTIAVAGLLYVTYANQRDSLEVGAFQLSKALTETVDRELVGAMGRLQALATSPSLQQGDLRSFYEQSKHVLATTPNALAVVLIDASGQQLMNTLRPFGDGLPKTGHPELVKRTIGSGEPSVSDLYVGGVAGRFSVAVEVPVLRGEKVAYALDMGFLPERLADLISAQKVPPGWVVAVLDRQGVVVARTQNMSQFIGKKATPDLLQRMSESAGGHFASQTLEGVPSFVAYHRSSMSGWTVAVAMERDVLYRQLYRLMILAVFAMAAFSLGAVAVAYFATMYIRKALLSLEAGAAAAATGNLSVSVPEDGPWEIALLAGQFNRMMAARKKAEDEAARLAYYDPLTNLPNRRLLTDRLQQAISLAGRRETQVAVCYLDLDGFKPINDTYGHAAGDCALLEIGRRLNEEIRAHDTVARLGGDEFVFLLADLGSTAECMAILERILAVVRIPIALDNETLVTISASIGVTFYPSDDSEPDMLLRHSDQALYQAKLAGRNCVRFFDPGQVPNP